MKRLLKNTNQRQEKAVEKQEFRAKHTSTGCLKTTFNSAIRIKFSTIRLI